MGSASVEAEALLLLELLLLELDELDELDEFEKIDELSVLEAVAEFEDEEVSSTTWPNTEAMIKAKAKVFCIFWFSIKL